MEKSLEKLLILIVCVKLVWRIWALLAGKACKVDSVTSFYTMPFKAEYEHPKYPFSSQLPNGYNLLLAPLP